MSQELHVIIQRDEEGWLVGSIPALPGCHTQASSVDELLLRMKEAAEAYLNVHPDEIVLNEFVGIERISVGA